MREGLRKYLNCYGSFRMQYVETSHVHAYLVHSELKSHLFRNVIDLANGFIVCKYIWLNSNKTIDSLQLSPGDIIEGEFIAEGFKQGTEYHVLNTTRGKVKSFRLLYPRNVYLVGHEDLVLDEILNLQDMQLYKDFDSYIQSLPHAHRMSKEEYWIRYIHLFDNCYKENLFNRLGNVINSSIPPYVIFKSDWDLLSQEEQDKIISCRKKE